MAECLICRAPIEPFLSFGRMPIANGFLSPDQFADEHFFELKVAFCPRCAMVQLAERVDPGRMFHDQYAFFSSTSVRMAAHFGAFSEWARSEYLREPDPFVVEIGSNDGIMLQHFATARVRHLGIEPSANVARVAIEKGIPTITRFFDAALAREIAGAHGQADLFIGANVMCHIADLHSVAEGIRLLLKPRGVLIFEDPYLGDIIEKTSYDQIYDEHAFYFSVASVQRLFAEHGLEVIAALPQAVHGGSMRYVLAHRGARRGDGSVPRQLAREEEMGLRDPRTYERLRRRVERSRDELRALLSGLRRRGSRIAGYAATSKSTTVINYCGITPDLLEYISDTTPLKQGKFSPGMHIPVRPREHFQASYPDYALLFGWNHAEEILAKEAAFRGAGGQWIVYVPEVKVLAG